MKDENILNDNAITQADKRNELAKKHVGHKLTKIGNDRHVAISVPYLTTRVQKYLCEGCKVIFEAYNTTEQKNKENYLKDTSYEE